MAGTDLIGSLVSRVATSQGIRLVAGSNITPEITLYDASAQGSLLDTLGIVAYGRVEDKNGNVLASYGQTQPLNLLLAVAYWGLIGVALVAILKGFIKR